MSKFAPTTGELMTLLSPEALLRLAGAVLVEAHDEWQVSDRRCLSEGSMALLNRRNTSGEVAQPALMASWSDPQKNPQTGPSYTTERDVASPEGD